MRKLIYDIGMHKGEDTSYYLNEGFNVLAIEANPELVYKAAKRFEKYIYTGRLTILNVGIAENEGVLTFYKNLDRSEWSTFNKPLASKKNTSYIEISVNCITTRQLFEKYGMPYYMKVDIEGSDLLCINDIPLNGEKPKYVSCEAGSIEILDTLFSRGYTKFKMISQGDNFTPININKERLFYAPYFQIMRNIIKLRLQKIIPFKNNLGSSGPFGENSKGDWLSYEEVSDLYLKFYSPDIEKPLNNQSWFDYHATY